VEEVEVVMIHLTYFHDSSEVVDILATNRDSDVAQIWKSGLEFLYAISITDIPPSFSLRSNRFVRSVRGVEVLMDMLIPVTVVVGMVSRPRDTCLLLGCTNKFKSTVMYVADGAKLSSINVPCVLATGL
jgi:hypothetical protein